MLDFVMRMERLPFSLALEQVARFPNGGSGDRRTSERSERVSRKVVDPWCLRSRQAA